MKYIRTVINVSTDDIIKSSGLILLTIAAIEPKSKKVITGIVFLLPILL